MWASYQSARRFTPGISLADVILLCCLLRWIYTTIFVQSFNLQHHHTTHPFQDRISIKHECDCVVDNAAPNDDTNPFGELLIMGFVSELSHRYMFLVRMSFIFLTALGGTWTERDCSQTFQLRFDADVFQYVISPHFSVPVQFIVINVLSVIF